MISQIYSLNELNTITSSQIRKAYGGKAFGLYQAYKLGLSVPETYLVSIEAYESFLLTFDSGERARFKQVAAKWFSEHFSSSLSKLPDGLYAVRSSSQFEDASVHSFAGIFESKLGIPKKELPEAVAEVWDSCFSFRVSSYAKELDDLRMGVIIQPLIEAKYAGVCFSKHPSPSSAYENQNIVIEFAASPGEKIVQGEVTPFRLSGSISELLHAIDAPWMPLLLKSLLLLKEELAHDIDMEFVVDPHENFLLLQQRPISAAHASHAIDLQFYQRKYKRHLHSLDIELLIEGCSSFLPSYLEVPYGMDRWMIMITGEDKQQELWTHEILEKAILLKMEQSIHQDPHYLQRLSDRYQYYYRQILEFDDAMLTDKHLLLEKRFSRFLNFILPLQAHYYVPLFVIDALHGILKKSMLEKDPVHAEKDLFTLATSKVRSLMDLLYEKLREITYKYPSLPKAFANLTSEDQKTLEELSKNYGFLKCRHPYEEGFTSLDLFSLMQNIPKAINFTEENTEIIKQKYFKETKGQRILEHFFKWMRIRNQEMEYFYDALIKSRPLFLEMANLLGISIKDFWDASRERIYQALRKNDKRCILEFSHEHLVIFKSYGKVHLHNHLVIKRAEGRKDQCLRGTTVFGSGKKKLKVFIGFHIGELKNFQSEEPTVLVTGMTTPDFIPYLRAPFQALVTDEGGILCHAAIVAREISIPCIVGMGMATEILKTGDYVNIDFDRAEVML